MSDLTEETVKQLIRAGITTGLGLKATDLQELAKQVVPVETPLLNMIPRVKGKGDTGTFWKAITGINTARLSAGVGEGHRNAYNTTTMQDKSAAYKSIGHDDFVTMEADWAGMGFDNIPAITKRNLLLSLKISEERLIYGGRGAVGLGRGNTPTVTTATSGGSMSNGLVELVYVVPLSHACWQASNMTTGVRGTVTRSNAGGTSDTQEGGFGRASATGTATTGAGSANKISYSFTPILGAAAYAIYIGDAVGTARLAAITQIPAGDILALPTTTQLLTDLTGYDADHSADSLVFDGLATQLSASGFGGYQKVYNGVALASDGAAGITQYNDAFQWFWDNWKLSPKKILVSGAKAVAIDKIIVANGGAPIMRVNTTPGGAIEAGRGGRVTSILNKVRNTEVEIVVHPDAPDSWDMFVSDSVPFPTSNIGSPVEVHYQRDYYGQDWPMTNRQYEYGVYARECLPIYADGAFGMIQGLTA